MTTGRTASIEDALLYHLSVLILAPAWPIAWPNLAFTPQIGQAYLEPRFLPNVTDRAGAGTNAARRHRGLFQVTCFGTENTGSAPSSEVADAIIEHFGPDVVIDRNGVRVRIGSFDGSSSVPYRSQGFNENGWWVVPVTIPWWCDIS